MHHLVFDTNILISEHFYSARMKILKRLIDAGLLTIYISEIVKREYLTNKYSEFKDKLKTKNLIDVDKILKKSSSILIEIFSYSETTENSEDFYSSSFSSVGYTKAKQAAEKNASMMFK